MEKYGQYRDKGSGIAPFFPISPPSSSPLLLPWYLFLFSIRLPLLLFACFVWTIFTQWTTPGTLLRKANLWCIVGIPGIWWVDLQVDGVRRGSLGKAPNSYIPGGGSIVAASSTSPVDIVYLATILDPIFTQSYPGTNLVKALSLPQALLSYFTAPALSPPDSGLLTLSALCAANPSRIIAVLPEGTASNGRSILHLTPSLLSASPKTKIYPVSLRYTPADIVTPIPGLLSAATFLWILLSSPTHCIRTRIGAPVRNTYSPETSTSSTPSSKVLRRNSYESNYFDTLQQNSEDEERAKKEAADGLTEPARRMLDVIADALARLGRVKRVSLGVRQKGKFVQAWGKGARARRS